MEEMNRSLICFSCILYIAQPGCTTCSSQRNSRKGAPELNLRDHELQTVLLFGRARNRHNELWNQT